MRNFLSCWAVLKIAFPFSPSQSPRRSCCVAWLRGQSVKPLNWLVIRWHSSSPPISLGAGWALLPVPGIPFAVETSPRLAPGLYHMPAAAYPRAQGFAEAADLWPLEGAVGAGRLLISHAAPGLRAGSSSAAALDTEGSKFLPPLPPSFRPPPVNLCGPWSCAAASLLVHPWEWRDAAQPVSPPRHQRFVEASDKMGGSVRCVASRELAFGGVTYTEEQKGDAQQKSELVSV